MELDRYTLYLPETLEPGRRDWQGPPSAPPSRWLSQWPARIPRAPIEAIARRLTAGASSDLERVRMMETYLKRRGEYTHHLEAYQGCDGSAALSRFLSAEHPRGHCELFASALALLTRSLNIPSRLAVGFLGGDWKDEEGELCVRYQDAHAWVEVWLPERGWCAFDPTPSAPLVSFSDRLPFMELRKWAARVLAGWKSLAQNSGAAAQHRVLAWAAARLEQSAARILPGFHVPSVWGKIKDGFRDPWVWALAAVLALINFLFAWALKWFRRRAGAAKARRWLGKSWPNHSQYALWHSLRRRLFAAAGIQERASQTAGRTFAEFLESESRARALSWPAVASALNFYESKRFGAREWNMGDDAQFQRLLAAVRRPPSPSPSSQSSHPSSSSGPYDSPGVHNP